LADTAHNETVVVIGLGRFGSQVAESLIRLGHEVLGIDENPEIVQRLADRFTHVVQADATHEDTLRQLGVGEFDCAVVGIGSDIEASVLTVLALTELKVPQIWAKAISNKHSRILDRVGAHHVVDPDAAMGERVAHLVTGKMIDFIEFDDDYAIAKTRAPRETHGRPLGDAQPRSRHGVTVVGVKRPGTDFIHATPETTVHPGDLLIVSGPTRNVERFAALP
jgi:trk system potassium uptake protein TrkA